MTKIQLDRTQSLLYAAGVAWGFVAVLYLWKSSLKLDRNHPSQIKRRMLSITLYGLLVPPLLFWCLSDKETTSFSSLLISLGWPAALEQCLETCLRALLLVLILFSGSLTQTCLEFYELHSKEEGALQVLHKLIKSHYDMVKHYRLIATRNYIIGPIFEEIVYRGCICSLLDAGGFSRQTICLLSPTLFGLAHLHHIIDQIKNKKTQIQVAVLTVAFQLFYTTLFGIFASIILLRTRNVLACILAHSWCNYLGFPDLSWVVDPKTPHRLAIASISISGILCFFRWFDWILI